MAWNGSGVFTRTNSVHTGTTLWQQDQAAGTGIVSDRHDYQDQDIATGLNNALCKDGQNSPTANLPMATYHHTNVSVATLYTDYARASQVQDGSLIYGGTTAGTTTAYTLTPTVVLNARVVGMVVRAKINATNTGVATLNVSGTGAANIVCMTGVQCPTGTLIINSYLDFMWDGTNWMVVSPATTNWVTYTPTLTGGVMTVSAYSASATAQWRYDYTANSIDVEQYFVCTTSGVASATVNASVPFTAGTNGAALPAYVNDTAVQIGLAFIDAATSVVVYKRNDLANFSLNTGRIFSSKLRVRL
jgi:hypothetical protein